MDPSGGVGGGLASAIETVFNEGTVIFCFIVLFLAIVALIARVIGLLIELRRARIRVLARQRDEERMALEAARIREENKKKAASYNPDIKVILPGQVTFEQVMAGGLGGASSGPSGAAGVGTMTVRPAGTPPPLIAMEGLRTATAGGGIGPDGTIAEGATVLNTLSHRPRGERKSYVTARVPQAGASMLPRIDSIMVASDPGTRTSTSSTSTTLK